MDRKRASGGLEDLQGKVQDPISGQVQYFSGGMDLLQILCRMVLWKESSDPAAAAGGTGGCRRVAQGADVRHDTGLREVPR